VLKPIVPRLQRQNKKINIVHFGIDTVRFNFDVDFEGIYFQQILEGLSINSNQKFGVHFFGSTFDILYSETKEKSIVQFLYFGDAVLVIEKMKTQTVARKFYWSITFYSAFFYINEMKSVISYFISQYERHLTVSRLDLCMDVTATVNRLYASHKTKSQKKMFYKKNQELETFYLGSKKNNKRHFIRVYNKKLDSQKKNKFHIFSNYLSLPVVSRIELQMNVASVAHHKILPFQVVEAMEDSLNSRFLQIFNYCCRNPSQTNFRCLGKAKRIETYSWARLDRSLQGLDNLSYARTMLGYAKRLHQAGFDVLDYLRVNLV